MLSTMPKFCSWMRPVVSYAPRRGAISMTTTFGGLAGPASSALLHHHAVQYQSQRFFNCSPGAESGIRRGLVGWTDLELAASTGDLSELNTLIARGADLGTVNENGQTALHFAAVNGHPRTIQLLIERGVDLNAEDSCGRTALVLAVQQRQKDAVEALVRYKPAISTEQLLKAVELAHGYDDQEILSILRSSNAPSNPDPVDQEYNCMGVHIEGNTRAPWEQGDAHAPIESACDRSMMPSPADCESTTTQEFLCPTALSPDDFDIASLEEGRRGLFSLLNDGRELTPDERTRIENSLTAIGKRMHRIESLIQSSIFGQLDRMKDLIKSSVEASTSTVMIDSTDELGWSALHWAAYKGHGRIVNFLLEQGADPTKLTRREGANPLICAVARQDGASRTRLQIVRALLKHGAQPNAQDGDGETPLHFAVGFLEYDIAQVLLENGADPSIRTNYSITVGENNFAAGSTPLHYAHQLGAENIVRLIASYAGRSESRNRESDHGKNLRDVNMARDSNGYTPAQLHPQWPCYMI